MKRDFLALIDYSTDEILKLLDSAAELKNLKGTQLDHLKGKSVGLVFQKPSNRTRVSFQVAVWQLGGNCLYLSSKEIDLGKRESTADVARTLSRYLNAIVARTYTHADVLELSRYASVPVINGLSDMSHPCQALADLLTIKEKFGTFKNLTLAYVGDGNNVCNSLLIGSAKVGLNINVASPKKYEPAKDIVAKAKTIAKNTGAKIQIMTAPQDAVKGAHAIYADVFVSMGQEAESKKRLKDLKNYQINAKLMKLADKNHIFLHCLPAHRGQEVTADVIDGPHSLVFDQAENRLHVQKAVLIYLLGKGN